MAKQEKTYNEYQKMHYTANFGAKPTKKRYGLYERNVLVLSEQPYPVLKAEMNKKIALGIKKTNLKILLIK